MNLGIGKIGDSTPIIRRKHRWTISGEFPNHSIPEAFVKVTSRPQLRIEEEEIAKNVWIPGKTKWDTITTTHYEVSEEHSSELFGMLSTFWEGVENTDEYDPEKDTEKHGTITLKMYDGCGSLLERWDLLQVCPKAINFGDLDFSSNDEVVLEITWAFQEARYENVTPTFSKEENE